MTKITSRVVNEVLLYWSKGNDMGTIAKLVELSEATVKKIIENAPPEQKLLLPVKSKQMEVRERIEEFERIIRNKKPSMEKGKELWDRSKIRHTDYKESYFADSRATFNFKKKYIGIATVADAHIGHEGVNLYQLEKDQDLIENTDNMYVVCCGDMMDMFLDAVKHQEAVLNATSPPKDQLYMFQYWLSRFKKPSSKILLVTKDNHVSARLKKACGVDYTNKIWSDENIFYGGEEILATLNVGDVTYKMVCRHKYRGGSKTDTTKACRNLLSNGVSEGVDIVALGHTHRGALEFFQYRDTMRVAIQAGTYKTYDPFGASLGFDPSVIFMPVLILNPYTKNYIFVDTIEAASKLLKKLNS
jgi:UDP-2,3-diacylglucosamine pyrophosphatase LpxH